MSITQNLEKCFNKLGYDIELELDTEIILNIQSEMYKIYKNNNWIKEASKELIEGTEFNVSGITVVKDLEDAFNSAIELNITASKSKKDKKEGLSKWEQLVKDKKIIYLQGPAIEEFVQHELKDKLRYNILNNQLELNERPFKLEEIVSEVYEQYNVDCTKTRLKDAVTKWCLRNEYNPVRNYLLNNFKTVEPLSDISNLATRYFGNEDPLDNILLMKWLLATASRGLHPGVKFDGSLILSGVKNAGKTSFFQEISKGWYTTDVTRLNGNKDMTQIACSSLIVVFDEFEKIVRQGSRQDIKSWITKDRDQFRVPYATHPVIKPRLFTTAGTCNDKDFLTESKDNRRFWIIDIVRKIKFEILLPEIDSMWAACVYYINNYLEQHKDEDPVKALRRLCELTDVELAALQSRSKRYAMTTSWDSIVEQFTNTYPFDYCWHDDIEQFAKQQNITPSGPNPTLKIKDSLNRLGYTQLDNASNKVWYTQGQVKSRKRWWVRDTPFTPEERASKRSYLNSLKQTDT